MKAVVRFWRQNLKDKRKVSTGRILVSTSGTKVMEVHEREGQQESLHKVREWTLSACFRYQV